MTDRCNCHPIVANGRVYHHADCTSIDVSDDADVSALPHPADAPALPTPEPALDVSEAVADVLRAWLAEDWAALDVADCGELTRRAVAEQRKYLAGLDGGTLEIGQ